MADEKAKQSTQYVVLAKGEDDGTWVELGVYRAGGEASAKRKALASQRPEGAVVVAVPSRSWKVEDLKPKLSFS